METSRDARGFLRRLEDRIEELVSRDDRVSLAFSGGLTSTLLATVARKRCDLICLVAGSPASPGARASTRAKQPFDSRLESVLLEAAISLGLPEEWARVAHRPPADGSGIGGLSED